MNPTVDEATANHPRSRTVRLHYLDWLRVILILGVFLYHAVSPFREGFDWHITNPEGSLTVSIILVFFWPWALPLFFLVAGAASFFALRRRSNRQYVSERIARLLIPLIVGSILLSPLQAYLEALNEGSYQGSFLSFIPEMLADYTSRNWFTPLTFTRWGFHLWFLAFLFMYSLLALPVFRWFERDTGGSLVSWLGRLVEKRGGILLFIIPLALSRVLVQPFFPEEHGWLDFVYSFLFFVFGYIIYSDDRFLIAIRRDRWLLVAGGIFSQVVGSGLYVAAGDVYLEWAQAFVVPWSILVIFLFALSSWCWALCVLYLAMTHLGFTNRRLVYGNETIMPFYLLHQPVIVVIAYFVVQWGASLPVKLLTIVISSFLITLGLVELLVRPFEPMRRLVGMKSKHLPTKRQTTRSAG